MGRHRITPYEECYGMQLRKECINQETGRPYTQADMAAYAHSMVMDMPDPVYYMRYTLPYNTITRIENDKPVTYIKALRYTEILNMLREENGLEPIAIEELNINFSRRVNQPHRENLHRAKYPSRQNRNYKQDARVNKRYER